MGKSEVGVVAWAALALAAIVASRALLGAPHALAEPGTEVVRWPAGHSSVAVCTSQTGRPSWVTARQFSDLVAETARSWSDVHEAVAVDYEGDCETSRSRNDGIRLSEVSWDGAAFADQPAIDSITFLETGPPGEGGLIEIRAARIVLRPWVLDPSGRPARHVDALGGLLGHEFGHLLGLAHSPAPQDLLYGGPITARQLSAGDRAALYAIYCPEAMAH